MAADREIPVAELYVALLHHPVYDKNGAIVTTAVTHPDVHDISRLSRTFGVRGFYVCIAGADASPAGGPHHAALGDRPGSTYNTTRKEALSVAPGRRPDEATADVEREIGTLPHLVATSARSGPGRVGFGELRRRLEAREGAVLMVLGTGWGLTSEILERADAILEPIAGTGDYNHLSVRAAAAIMLDRLRGDR